MSGDRMSPCAIERERAADGVGLLPERAKESADDLRLPVQVHEPLLERAREPHPVVELELLLARQRVGRARRRARCGSRGHRSVRRCERVRRIGLAVQLDEEALHVAVEPALAHLVGDRLDEGVVAALGARAELRRVPSAPAYVRARGGCRARRERRASGRMCPRARAPRSA